MKCHLFRMKCILLILLVQCTISAVYFNKTIKWDHHQQVAKKLLAVAAVIHEAIQLQDNFSKALSRDQANHHSDG